jgi:hypothetical protein
MACHRLELEAQRSAFTIAIQCMIALCSSSGLSYEVVAHVLKAVEMTSVEDADFVRRDSTGCSILAPDDVILQIDTPAANSSSATSDR